MRKGFTLIELLVVIAIIAILAAILFPVFGRARAKAQQNDCLSNVKQIQLSMIMYASDNNNTGPVELQGPSYPANYDMQWPSEVLPYIKNLQIFLCPSDSAPFATAAGNTVPVLSYGRNDSCRRGGGRERLLKREPGSRDGMMLGQMQPPQRRPQAGVHRRPGLQRKGAAGVAGAGA